MDYSHWSHSNKTFLQVKPFQCSHCGKQFGFTSHLKRHLSIYNGDKPYKCNHCDCSFTHIHFFTKHMRTHLEKVAYQCCRLFQCCYCDMSFLQADSILKHMVLQTWKERNPPTDCDEPEPQYTTFRVMPKLSINIQSTQSVLQLNSKNTNTDTLSEPEFDIKDEPLDIYEVKEELLDNYEVKEEKMDIFVQTGIIENNNNESPNVRHISQEPQGQTNPQGTNLHPALNLPQVTNTQPTLKLQQRLDTQLTLQQPWGHLMPQEINTKTVMKLPKGELIVTVESKYSGIPTMHEPDSFHEGIIMDEDYRLVNDYYYDTDTVREPDSFHDGIGMDNDEKQKDSKTSNTDTVCELDRFHKEIVLDENELQTNFGNSDINTASEPDSFHKDKVMHKDESMLHGQFFQESKAQSTVRQSRRQIILPRSNTIANLHFPDIQESLRRKTSRTPYECNKCNETFLAWSLFSTHKMTCDKTYDTTGRQNSAFNQNYTTFRSILHKGVLHVTDNGRLSTNGSVPVAPASNGELKEKCIKHKYNDTDTLHEPGIFQEGLFHKKIVLDEDKIQMNSKTSETNISSETNSVHEEIVVNVNDSMKSDYYRNYFKTFKQNTEAFKQCNLDNEDMVQGAKLVHHQKKHYNYELGTNITDRELYRHMKTKYAIVRAEHCIGTRKTNSYHQVTKTWLKTQAEMSTL